MIIYIIIIIMKSITEQSRSSKFQGLYIFVFQCNLCTDNNTFCSSQEYIPSV